MSQDDLNLAKKIAISLGLESRTLKFNKNELCKHCYLRRTGNLAILYPCKHELCSTCLDRLYDNFDIKTDNLLFICPYCNSYVQDLLFKI